MKVWDPKSKIKQEAEKSIQESCNKHNHVNTEQTGCLETTENIAIDRPDTAKTEPLEKEANDDIRSHKQRDIYEEDIDDWATRGIIDSKATDHELEIDDEYWDTLTHVEENEMIRDDDSETDEEIFWDSLTEPEEITETVMFEKNDFGRKSESKSESVWDNQHINKTIKTIPKLNKDNKKMIKLRRDFLTSYSLSLLDDVLLQKRSKD